MSNQAQALSGIDLATAAELAAQLRVDSIRSSTSAGSGHGSGSSQELLAAAGIDAGHIEAAARELLGG